MQLVCNLLSVIKVERKTASDTPEDPCGAEVAHNQKVICATC